MLSHASDAGPWQVWVGPSGAEGSGMGLPSGWRGDGIIARVETRESSDVLGRFGVPVVQVADRPVAGICGPCVRTDESALAGVAADHFTDRGLRNIGVFGAGDEDGSAGCEDGFERVLAERGIVCQRLLARADGEEDGRALLQWLRELPKPAGVFARRPEDARSVVDRCLEGGIIVPHEVAVLCGSDDEWFAHSCDPALSGVDSPVERIGSQAAALLDELMIGGVVGEATCELPPRGVVERGSTDTLAVRDPQLVQVIEFIREHAFGPLTMDDILRAVPMARRTLERRFAQTFGRSPADEIRRVRIGRARKLLSETNLRMQEIAESCGYASYNYLDHVFKRSTGMTPRDFRKQFKE